MIFHKNDDKRRVYITVALSIISIGLAAAAFLRFFPRLMKKMMERCMDKMCKEGAEPPECCKKMMEKSQKEQPIKRKRKRAAKRSAVKRTKP